LILYGNPRRRSGVRPFNIEGLQHYDVGVLLDTLGVAVRTGQHCTQPIMDALCVSGTIRASLGLYSSREDIDALTDALRRVLKMLKRHK
jgi:cysteine desulfurase/selenocysteine lyase